MSKNRYPGTGLFLQTKGNHNFFDDDSRPLFTAKQTPKKGKAKYKDLWLAKHATCTVEDDDIVIRIPVSKASHPLAYRVK